MFLGERFGLMGDDAWEKLAISSFYSNIHFLRERTFSEVQDVPKQFKKEARETFFKHTLRKFIEDHEYHLAQNGNNGHYVGNKVESQVIRARLFFVIGQTRLVDLTQL